MTNAPESPTAVGRSDPRWTVIFNAIPSEVLAGSEPRPLVFSQRAFIADRVLEGIITNA